MSNNFHIRYVLQREIDRAKWDQSVDAAANGLIYGYTFYLDHMTRHWDALVLNDYEAVMPLTWNRKMGITYLYQPAFTANLGIFGKDITAETTRRFLEAIPSKFKLIEISLNNQNPVDLPPPRIISRVNYILLLRDAYTTLYGNYRENHRRNIQKAIRAGCAVDKNIDVEQVIVLNRQQMRDIAPTTDSDYERFKKLYHFLAQEKKAVIYGIPNPQKNLIAAAVFFIAHKRVYYILAGNHPAGKATGASHLLIDAFIKDHAGEDLVLDFEGSDIESLGLFYGGFGATKEMYPAIRWNRLPGWLKWIK